MSRFNIEKFKSIYENLDNKELNNNISNILLNIGKEINCKVIFSKKENDNKYQDYLKNFKYTVIKNDSNDELKYIQNIKKILNKITNNNYINFYDDILTNINYVNNNFNNKYEYFCKEIFKLLNSNLLYNKPYSLIFKKLITDDNIFNNILNEQINNFDKLFDNLIYISPESDYDNFCEYNKNNEKRRSNILFFSNLFVIDIISINIIKNFFYNLLNKFNNYIINDNKIYEAYEITECIYILIINTYEKINEINSEIYNNILNEINILSKLKIKDYKSLTNKSIFKLMNIIDQLT
jgi:acyl-CoA synthetase (AMP-forming)/AMP-acid ligase II